MRVATIRKGAFAVFVAALVAAAAPPAAGAAPTVALSADQTAVRNGTTVNFTLTVTKSPTADHAGINNLIDNLDGPIDGKGSCITSPTGPDLTVLKPTFACTYPFVVDGRPGSTQTHTLNAVGVETFCNPPPLTPGGPCPEAVSDVAFASLSNDVVVTLKCKKKQKLRKGRCRPRK